MYEILKTEMNLKRFCNFAKGASRYGLVSFSWVLNPVIYFKQLRKK